MKIRARFSVVAAAAALVLAGCIKQKTLVVVNPDGSGNIVVSTAMSPQMAQMMGGMADGLANAMGGATGDAKAPAAAEKKDPLFNEDELKKDAGKYGEGVSYVKAHKSDENGWKGSVAVYSFGDIGKVKIPLNEDKNIGPGGDADTAAAPGKPEKKKQFLTFALAGDDTKTLTINVPQEEKKAEAKPAEKTGDDAAAGAAGKQMGDAMGAAMMGPMLSMMQGMEVGIAIKVKGKITSTTASHKQGDDGVTILHMDADKMKDSPKFAKIMQGAQGGGDMPTSEMLGMPGFEFETNKVVEIQFK